MAAGQELTQDEVAEYLAYSNNGLTQPEKFANVIIEGTSTGGHVMRYPTDEETKAKADATAAAEAANKKATDLSAKVRADAQAAAAAEAAPPPMPTDVKKS